MKINVPPRIPLICRISLDAEAWKLPLIDTAIATVPVTRHTSISLPADRQALYDNASHTEPVEVRLTASPADAANS